MSNARVHEINSITIDLAEVINEQSEEEIANYILDVCRKYVGEEVLKKEIYKKRVQILSYSNSKMDIPNPSAIIDNLDISNKPNTSNYTHNFTIVIYTRFHTANIESHMKAWDKYSRILGLLYDCDSKLIQNIIYGGN